MQILRLILLKLKPLVSTLCMILLFGPSAARATITATLENPPDGEHMSGIHTISGWAYSDTGAPVSVRLRIDGEHPGSDSVLRRTQRCPRRVSGRPFGHIFQFVVQLRPAQCRGAYHWS